MPLGTNRPRLRQDLLKEPAAINKALVKFGLASYNYNMYQQCSSALDRVRTIRDVAGGGGHHGDRPVPTVVALAFVRWPPWDPAQPLDADASAAVCIVADRLARSCSALMVLVVVVLGEGCNGDQRRDEEQGGHRRRARHLCRGEIKRASRVHAGGCSYDSVILGEGRQWRDDLVAPKSEESV